MTSRATLQQPRIPIVDRDGKLTLPWQRYFRELDARTGGPEAETNLELSERVDSLEPHGYVPLWHYLNDDRSNGKAAIEEALAKCAELRSSGTYDRVILDGGGIFVPVEPGLTIGESGRNVTVVDLSLMPAPGNWIEDDPTDVAFFSRYETVSSEEKVWSLRKPVLTIIGGSTALQFVRPQITGIDADGLRVAAGVRVKGSSAIGRRLMMGRIDACESYGLFIGADTANDSGIDLFDMQITPNGQASRGDRTSYAAVLAGSGMHWLRVTLSSAHCPLLVGQHGSETIFVDSDISNGAEFDPGASYPHRLVEYHGNSCTFNGGLWGDGSPHIFNPSMHVFSPKFSVTDGWQSRPAAYFVLYASKVDDDLENFSLTRGEMPTSMRDGSIKLFSCVEDGGNTWRAGIKDAMERIDGYTEVMAGKVTQIGQGAGAAQIEFQSTTTAGALIALRAPDTDAGKKAGFGNIGNEVHLRRGEDSILTVTETNVVSPFGDRVFNLGRVENQWGEVYARRTVTDDVTLRRGPTLELPQAGSMAIRFESDGDLTTVDEGGNVFTYKSDQSIPELWITLPSGSTGVAAAIQAAHDFLRTEHGGGVIKLPAGFYTLDAPVTIHPSVSIHGAVRAITRLKFAANMATVGPEGKRAGFYCLARAQDVEASSAWRSEFMNLWIDGSKGLQSGNEVFGFLCERGILDPDYATWAPTGDAKAYSAPKWIGVEVANTSGTAYRVEGDRQRAYWEDSRAISCGVMSGSTVVTRANGIHVLGNDPVIGPRCGSGGHTGHSVLIAGCSGLLMTGVNCWGPTPLARGAQALAVHMQNVNGFAIVGNVFNDTVSFFGGASNEDRANTFIGNHLKPLSSTFSADGVAYGDPADEFNAFIRARGYRNLNLGPNDMSSASNGRRFMYAAAFDDECSAHITIVGTSESAIQPWASTSEVPLSIASNCTVTWDITNHYTGYRRIGSKLAIGFGAGATTDLTRDLSVAGETYFGGVMTLNRPVRLIENQSVDYPSMTSGGTYLIPNKQQATHFRNPAVIASQTLELPYLPSDDAEYVVTCVGGITALTVQLNTTEIDPGTGLPYSSGHTIAYAPTTLGAGGRVAWRFRSATKVWYPA